MESNGNSASLIATKDRNADYSLVKVATPFEPTTFPESSSGKIQFCMGKKGDYSAFYDNWGDKVAAPYALARLCALFEGLIITTGGQEGYKTTWHLALKHKTSGVVVTFYDYKGGLSMGSNAHNTIPADLKKDLKKLLDALVNDRCPHPYDGCVVGEIA
jgi:hypothetical protein